MFATKHILFTIGKSLDRWYIDQYDKSYLYGLKIHSYNIYLHIVGHTSIRRRAH